MDLEERAALATALFESLVEAGDEADEVWEAEVDRRLDELDQGTALTVSAQEVFSRVGRTFRGR